IMDSGLIPVKRSSGVVNAARGAVAVWTGGGGGGGDGATLGPNARFLEQTEEGAEGGGGGSRVGPRLSASHLTHLVVLAGLPVVALRLRLALGLAGSRPLVLVAVSVRVLVLVVVLVLMELLLLLLLLTGVLSSSSLQRTFTTQTDRQTDRRRLFSITHKRTASTLNTFKSSSLIPWTNKSNKTRGAHKWSTD
ncbi:hypothetical protein M9458_050334, partial [Cirrhinus mrigala]